MAECIVHEFERNRENSTCHICFGTWPSSEGVVAKYHSCCRCGLNVHSCCRLMASRCCSCVSGISLPQKIDLYSNFMRQGKVVLKILHTYDIYSIGPGTVLYCSFAISSSKQAHVETDTAIVGENDCIWNGGAAGEVNEETDCQLLVQAKILFLHRIRWFPLVGANSEASGQVLLRMKFIPAQDTSLPVHSHVEQLPLESHPIAGRDEPTVLMESKIEPKLTGSTTEHAHNYGDDDNGDVCEDSKGSDLSSELARLQELLIQPQYTNSLSTVEREGQHQIEHQHQGGEVIVGMVSDKTATSEDSPIDSSNPLSPASLFVSTDDSDDDGADDDDDDDDDDALTPESEEIEEADVKALAEAIAQVMNDGNAILSRDVGLTSTDDIGGGTCEHSCGYIGDKSHVGEDAAAIAAAIDEAMKKKLEGGVNNFSNTTKKVSMSPSVQATVLENSKRPKLRIKCDSGAFVGDDEGIEGSEVGTTEDLSQNLLNLFNSTDSVEGVKFIPSVNSRDSRRPSACDQDPAQSLPSAHLNISGSVSAQSSTRTVTPRAAPPPPLPYAAAAVGAASLDIGAETSSHLRQRKKATSVPPSPAAAAKAVKPFSKDDSFSTHINAPLDSTMLYDWAATIGNTAKGALSYIFYDVEPADDFDTETPSVDLGLRNRIASKGPKLNGLESAGGKGGSSRVSLNQKRRHSWNDSARSHAAVMIEHGVTEEATAYSPAGSVDDDDGAVTEGIGKLFVHLLSAAKADAVDAAEGDYFVVATIEDGGGTGTGDTTWGSAYWQQLMSTKLIRSSATPFFNKHWVFVVPHYKAQLHLTLMAADRTKVGQTKIPLYQITMRDAELHGCDWCKAGVENFHIRDCRDEKVIVGHFSAQIRFKEDTKNLFLAADPRLAVEPPQEELSVERLSAHIARFQAVITFIVDLYNEYLRIMDWEDAIFTLLLFFFFVVACVYINAEYALCCPVFILLAIVTRTWHRRTSGYYRTQLIKQSHKSNEPHRAVAILRIAIVDYRNMPPSFAPQQHSQASMTGSGLSSGLGLSSGSAAGSTSHHTQGGRKPYARITYTPIPFPEVEDAASTEKELLVGSVDGSKSSSLSKIMSKLITGGVGVEAADGDALIHNVMHPWPLSSASRASARHGTPAGHDDDDESICFMYPILQSMGSTKSSHSNSTPTNIKRDTAAASADASDDFLSEEGAAAGAASSSEQKPASNKPRHLIPWHETDGFVKVAVYDENPNGLIDSLLDSSWGVVKIPIKDLVPPTQDKAAAGLMPEINGWFPLVHEQHIRKSHGSVDDLGVLETSVFGSNSRDDIDSYIGSFRSQASNSSTHRHNLESSAFDNREDRPSVFLRLQLDLRRSPKGGKEVTEEEKEASLVLQNLIAGKKHGASAMSTLWNMRDNIRSVQNLLALILDYIESFKNIFLWTSPSKTYPLYLCLVGIWLATVFIPGRFLILAIGLYQFIFKFLPEPEGIPLSIKFSNLLQSVPNDDDLAHVYRWERRDHTEKMEAERIRKHKTVKMNLILKSLWAGEVRLKYAKDWEEAYLVLQGRRVAWWGREQDADEGRAALGQLLLFGHAGATQASPLDIREVGGDDSRLVTIFGRDSHSAPMKCSVQCRDTHACRLLTAMVGEALLCQDTV